MNLFKAISPSNPRFQEIEFSLLLGWALLYPAKIGYSYFLGFMCLLAVFVLCKAWTLKNVAFDRFSLLLLAFNAVFIFSAFFSPYPLKSLLFVADVLLVSLWSMFFFMEKAYLERYLSQAAGVISLSSLVVVVVFVLQGGRGLVTPCFKNPILQGIASALAVLIFLHALLRRYHHAHAALLALNLAAVVVCASKAASLGLAAFAAAMLFRRRGKWLASLAGLLLLLAVFPNPLRHSLLHSLRHDPYVFDRLDIWSMSARMYRHHPWTGVGPGLFAEAAPRFNFAQDKGPSRYGKVPESPHSDFWLVIVETGLPGLILVLALFFFAIRRLLSPPRLELAKLLLAFLLTQMLLFNIVFQFFFLVIFLFLLHDFCPAGRSFLALHRGARVWVSGLLACTLFILYLLPLLGNRCLQRASGEKDLVSRHQWLKKAAFFSPLDPRVPLARAELLRAFARSRSDLAAWANALENARLAQNLNQYGTEALVLESELFRDVRVRGRHYQGQEEEILEPLRRAEKLAPRNPFLLMRQALVLREFGRVDEARKRAQAALDLEPDYLAALVFVHELRGAPVDDPGLRERIARIREKAGRLRAGPGSYLFHLHELPGKAPGQ